jgi:hypothetical protein
MGTDVCLTYWSRLIDLLVVRHVALVESLDNTAETDLGSGLVFDIHGRVAVITLWSTSAAFSSFRNGSTTEPRSSVYIMRLGLDNT